MRMPKDANAKSIQVLRPLLSEDVSGAASSAAPSEVARLCSSGGCTYAVGAASGVVLPANIVEYIRVFEGETITITGSCNVTFMS